MKKIFCALLTACLMAVISGCAVYTVNPDGSQTFHTLSGDEFIGTAGMDVMRGGGLTGQGRLNMKNGDVFEGLLVNGKPHGNGAIRRKSGDLYQGGFYEGVYHGKGRLVATDGTDYTGGFQSGAKHGRGRESYKDRSGVFDVVYDNGKLVKSDILIERESTTPRILEK